MSYHHLTRDERDVTYRTRFPGPSAAKSACERIFFFCGVYVAAMTKLHAR